MSGNRRRRGWLAGVFAIGALGTVTGCTPALAPSFVGNFRYTVSRDGVQIDAGGGDAVFAPDPPRLPLPNFGPGGASYDMSTSPGFTGPQGSWGVTVTTG